MNDDIFCFDLSLLSLSLSFLLPPSFLSCYNLIIGQQGFFLFLPLEFQIYFYTISMHSSATSSKYRYRYYIIMMGHS